jgi:hypothetical protein
MLRRVLWCNFKDVSEVLVASIIRAIMEGLIASGTSVNFYQTARRNIPQDSDIEICRLENLKSHQYPD